MFWRDKIAVSKLGQTNIHVSSYRNKIFNNLSANLNITFGHIEM